MSSYVAVTDDKRNDELSMGEDLVVAHFDVTCPTDESQHRINVFARKDARGITELAATRAVVFGCDGAHCNSTLVVPSIFYKADKKGANEYIRRLIQKHGGEQGEEMDIPALLTAIQTAEGSAIFTAEKGKSLVWVGPDVIFHEGEGTKMLGTSALLPTQQSTLFTHQSQRAGAPIGSNQHHALTPHACIVGDRSLGRSVIMSTANIFQSLKNRSWTKKTVPSSSRSIPGGTATTDQFPTTILERAHESGLPEFVDVGPSGEIQTAPIETMFGSLPAPTEFVPFDAAQQWEWAELLGNPLFELEAETTRPVEMEAGWQPAEAE